MWYVVLCPGRSGRYRVSFDKFHTKRRFLLPAEGFCFPLAPRPHSPRRPIIVQGTDAALCCSPSSFPMRVSPSAAFVRSTSLLFHPLQVCDPVFLPRPAPNHLLQRWIHSRRGRLSCCGLPRGTTDFLVPVSVPRRTIEASPAMICSRQTRKLMMLVPLLVMIAASGARHSFARDYLVVLYTARTSSPGAPKYRRERQLGGHPSPLARILHCLRYYA